MAAFMICWCVFVLGLLILGIVNALQRNRDLEATGIRTTGTVVRNQIRWGRTTVVRPIVRFQTQAGQTVEFMERHGVALLIPRYRAGESVRVFCNPTDPSDFAIV